jgi:hypothetical protein
MTSSRSCTVYQNTRKYMHAETLISNSRMQITLLSLLFKKFNIIKKGININNTLKLYAVLFSCFIYAKGQRPSGFKAIIKSIFKTNLPLLTSAPFF